MTIMFGIKQCDTVKKAKKWLDKNNIPFQFHDLREDGINQGLLNEWLGTTSIDELVNRKSTTWRTLSENDKKQLTSSDAVHILLKNPTLIKRPVIIHNNKMMIGFKENDYQTFFTINVT